jgi:replicative DNA helicase
MSDTLTRPGTPVAEGPMPPQSLEAERSVLAAMMLDHESIGRALELIEPTAFYRVAHQKIFESVIALYNRNERADLITVAEELRKRGDLEAIGGQPALAQVLEYDHQRQFEHARIVNAKWLLRSLIKSATEIQQECFADSDESGSILDRAEQRIFAITDRRVRQGLVSLKELLKPAFEQIQSLYERKTLVTGVPSGYEDLDRMTSGSGRRPGDHVALDGKDVAGHQRRERAIHHKIPIAVFSLEMSKEQLVLRMLGSQSEVPLHKIRNGYLGQEDWPRLTTGAGLLTQAPIMIDDSASLTVFEIRAKCRRLKSEGKLGLVVVDYLQLIRGSGRPENRVQEVSQITRGLKALAKELNVPIIALSQLSRAPEQRGTDRRPMLSDLRESGSVEQDADVVVFVFREEYYKPDDPELKGKATLIVSKQRNGPTGDVTLTFLRECTKFLPYSPITMEEGEPAF